MFIYYQLTLLFRKCRAQLTKANIKKLCVELSKMFPVTGKTNSFSLRTSAILTHGIFLMYKFKIDLVRKDLMRLGSITIHGKSGLLLMLELFCSHFLFLRKEIRP